MVSKLVIVDYIRHIIFSTQEISAISDRYHTVYWIMSISRPSMIFVIYINIGQYLKPWSQLRKHQHPMYARLILTNFRIFFIPVDHHLTFFMIKWRLRKPIVIPLVSFPTRLSIAPPDNQKDLDRFFSSQESCSSASNYLPLIHVLLCPLLPWVFSTNSLTPINGHSPTASTYGQPILQLPYRILHLHPSSLSHYPPQQPASAYLFYSSLPIPSSLPSITHLIYIPNTSIANHHHIT